MTSEERFKNQLNDLLESKDFAFDENNWENARKLIDDTSGKRKGFFPYAITTLFLLLSAVLGFYFLSPANSLADTTSTMPQKEQRAVKPLTPETMVTFASDSELPQHVKTHQPSSKIKNPPVQKSIASNRSSKVTVFQVNQTNPTTQKNIINHVVEPLKVETTKVSNDVNTVESVLPTNAALVDNTYIAKTTVPISEETITKAVSEEPIKIEKLEPTNHKTENKPASNNSEMQTNHLPNTGPVSNVNETEVAVSPPPANHTPEITSETLLPASQSASLASSVKSEQPDTASTLNSIDDANFPQKSRFPLLTLEVGTSYLFGWKNPNGSDAKGFNPLVGLSYYTYLRPKISILIGAQYSSIGKLSYSSVTSKITSFGMGEESRVTVITPQRLHYLIVPIKFNYHVTAKNTIGMGCNIAYLLTVDAKIESYEQGLNYPRNYNVGKTRGYSQGFKTFDTQLSVYYRRMIYKNLSLNTEGFFGLTDIKENKFFGLNGFERSKGFKLTLVYNLKNK